MEGVGRGDGDPGGDEAVGEGTVEDGADRDDDEQCEVREATPAPASATWRSYRLRHAEAAAHQADATSTNRAMSTSTTETAAAAERSPLCESE